MKTYRRSELREATFLILFRLDFYPNEEMEFQIKDFFDGEEEFTEEERQYIADKVLGVASHLAEIDAAIEQRSIGWKVKRMAKVDLTILRLAYYEMKYDDGVPTATAINEAVELAKNYGEGNSASFINGILAKAAKDEG